MASGNSSLVVKVSANIDAMKAALQLGEKELIKVAGAATALAKSMDGAKLEQNAKAMAVAITTMGGATQLTAAEAKKADATFQAWFEKAAKSGKAVSPELQKIAAETKRVTEETKKAEEETRKLAEAEKRLAEEAKKAGEASGGFFAKLAAGVAVGTLVADALKKIGEMAVQAFTSAAMAVPNMIKATMDLGGSLFDMSLKTGASVENLSRLRYVSSQTGIGMDSFVLSMSKMQMNLGQVGTKADELRARFGALGLDMTKLKNSKPDEAFLSVMMALEKIPNRADQAAAGMAIFGRGFKDMAGLTQESITELMQAADDLGLTMSTELAAAADIAGDAIARIKMQWEALTLRIGAAFLPALIGIAENFSAGFKEAVDEANKSLGEMGGGTGFLATVARAMGTGNEAIAAQVQLYEYLRDALISVIRYGVVPLVEAFSLLMSWFYKQKVQYDLAILNLQYLEMAYQRVGLAVVALKNIASSATDYAAATKPWRDALDEVNSKIKETQKTIVLDAVASSEWAKSAERDSAVILKGLDNVEGKHLDIADMIAKNAALSRAASGAQADGLAETADAAIETAKKLASLNDEAQRIATAYAKMSADGLTAQQIFEALGSSAAGLRAKFAAFGAEAPADVQKVIDALKKFGTDINIAKWMQQQTADIRKILEESAKHTAEVVAKQRDAINKAFIDNAGAQVKAAEGLERLEQDSLQKRLGVVEREMQARRAALDKNASNYESSLATVTRYEEEAAAQATQAWLEHVADVKAAMGPSFLDIFNNALKGIPDILTAAFTGGGGVGGAISGVLSDLGGALGTKLGGMLANSLSGVLGKLGAKVGGAIFDMIPGIGGAIGAMVMPALDKAWGWISKREGREVNDLRDAYIKSAGGYEKLVEQARKAGVELSSSSAFQRANTVEAWNKAIADLDAKLKASVEARKKMMAEAMAGERLATQAFVSEMQTLAAAGGDAAKEATDYFSATLKTAASGLTTMFAGLEKGATAAAQAAAVKMHMAAGMTEEAAKKEAASIVGIFVKTQAQATGLAGAIAGTFGKMIENGATFREALAAIKGPLDTLRKQLELTGLSGGAAFENLSRMGQIADGEITGPLMDAISGANQALIGLHNSGLLNQESFAALAVTATDAYNAIIAEGADGQAALQMMQPTLQTMWELQEKFGYETDAATQALIDQAVEAGTVGEAHMSAAERTAKSMEKVAVIMEAIARKMGVDLPAAAETGARRIDAAFNGIDPAIAEPWADWDEPPEIKIPYSFEQQGEGPEGMASGGVVYAAGGWMQPKGSDIVPAMLTPGERVLTTGQNYDYEHRMRTDAGAGAAATQINITIQALDPAGLKQVVEKEVAPLLVSAYRRNVNGLRTDTRKELVE
jgi:hypothetical protein